MGPGDKNSRLPCGDFLGIRPDISKYHNGKLGSLQLLYWFGKIIHDQIWAIISRRTILLHTNQSAMGGLRSKEFMQWSTKGSLPGPESTLEAPASQDAQKKNVVLQFFIMSSYFNTLSECLNNHRWNYQIIKHWSYPFPNDHPLYRADSSSWAV